MLAFLVGLSGIELRQPEERFALEVTCDGQVLERIAKLVADLRVERMIDLFTDQHGRLPSAVDPTG